VKQPFRIRLGRRPTLGALLEDSLRVYFSRFGAFVAVTATLVVPIELIVEGIGLRQLWEPYPSRQASPALLAVGTLQGLIAGALVTPGCIHQLLAAAEGRSASARDSIRAALDAFAPVLLVTLIYALLIAAGLVLLVLPGVFVAVRFYLGPEVVVIEGKRGLAALRRSSELVRGAGWRVFGVGLVSTLLAGTVGVLIQLPFDAAARAADSAAILLVGGALAQALTTPVVALVATLLYFDLRARKESEDQEPEAVQRP